MKKTITVAAVIGLSYLAYTQLNQATVVEESLQQSANTSAAKKSELNVADAGEASPMEQAVDDQAPAIQNQAPMEEDSNDTNTQPTPDADNNGSGDDADTDTDTDTMDNDNAVDGDDDNDSDENKDSMMQQS